jgi:hypothetical protein
LCYGSVEREQADTSEVLAQLRFNGSFEPDHVRRGELQAAIL